MIGQKGLPATHGGIERHVEELAGRLAGRGHDVTVYCRPNYGHEVVGLAGAELAGVRLRSVGTISSKHLDAIVHSTASTVLALRERPDIVHYHGIGPGLVAPLPRYLSRAKVVLTVHGLDNRRDKWGRGARAVLGTAYRMSGYVPHARVAVARWLAEHYDDRFGRLTRYQPNGVNPARLVPAGEIVTRFGLTPGRYVLLVGRLVPEKAADLLIRAYREVDTDVRLAIVGGSSYTDAYGQHLRDAAAGDDRVVFTGYAYGDLLAELYSHAALFVQPSRVEGLPLTLLEAASYGLPLIASDIPPHVEVFGQDGPGRRLFHDGDAGDLRQVLTRTLRALDAERVAADDLRAGVLHQYQWDHVARDLEKLYFDLTGVST
jgi:glycosyltransferase involved in cell wall biosynthesis